MLLYSEGKYSVGTMTGFIYGIFILKIISKYLPVG